MAKRGRPFTYDHSAISAVAAGLQVSTTAVGKWVRRPDWPFGPHGPWDLAKVAEWRSTTLDDARGGRAGHVGPIEPGDDDEPAGEGKAFPVIVPTGDPHIDSIMATMRPTLQAKLRGEIERGKRTALENAITQRGLIDRHEVEKGWTARVIAVRSRLLALPKQLAADLAMRTEVEVEELLDRELRAVCESFAAES